jgi:hypothetical protein
MWWSGNEANQPADNQLKLLPFPKSEETNRVPAEVVKNLRNAMGDK